MERFAPEEDEGDKEEHRLTIVPLVPNLLLVRSAPSWRRPTLDEHITPIMVYLPDGCLVKEE